MYKSLEHTIRTLNEGRGHDAVQNFASSAHDEWRKGFDPEGSGKERIKKNSDGSEGNINVPFNKLHPDWQKENLEAGKAALVAVRKHPNDIEKASEHVHNEWMKRNPKAEWNASQHVPYSELPDEEKEKDRVHVKKMHSILGTGAVKEYYSLEHSIRNVMVEGGETEHRVGVTVSDPNHTMVTKRKETILKHVRVKAKNEAHAQEKAKAYFRKKGYKIHDSLVTTMKEDINNTDKFVGDKKPESPNPVPRITPDATKGAKDASLTRQNSKQEKSQTMGNNVEEGALDAADTAAEYLVPYYSAGKKLYKGDKAGAAQDAAIDTALLATTGGIGKVLGGAARAGSKLLGGAVRSGEKAGIKAGEKAAITGAEKAGASALEKDAAKVAATDAEKTVAKTAAVDAEKAAGRVAATDAAKGFGKALTIGSAAMSGRKALPQHISASQHGNIVGHQPNINVHRAMKHRRMAEETGTDARETIEAMPRSDIKDRKDVQYVGRPDSASSPMDKRSVLIRQEIQKKVIDESKRNADIIKQVKKEKGNTQQKETTMGDRKTRVFGDVIINPQLNDPNPGSGTVTS